MSQMFQILFSASLVCLAIVWNLPAALAFVEPTTSAVASTKQIRKRTLPASELDTARKKNIIAYSLPGTDANTTTQTQLVHSMKFVREHFPSWEVWIYHDSKLNTTLKSQLLAAAKKGAAAVTVAFIDMSDKRSVYPNAQTWAFSVATDPLVHRYLIRNADSRLSLREKLAVDEWIASGKSFHTMRDHPGQCEYPVNAGMWAGSRMLPPYLTTSAEKDNLCPPPCLKPAEAVFNENEFLKNYLWPHLAKDVLQHASFSCGKFGPSTGFPSGRIGYEYVGSGYIDDKPQVWNRKKLLEAIEANLECGVRLLNNPKTISTCTADPAAAQHYRNSSIYYFAVSHPSAKKQEIASRKTWAKDMNVTWFTTEKTFRDSVIVSVIPNTYANINARMLKVWDYVWQNEPNYDWYVRLWPDNYVFQDRMDSLVQEYDPNEPVIIGRSGFVKVYSESDTKHPEKKFQFLGGGAGWVVSKGAMRAWNKSANGSFSGTCNSNWLPRNLRYAEDVIISKCFHDAGARIQPHSGFCSHPFNFKDNGLTAFQAAAGVPTQEALQVKFCDEAPFDDCLTIRPTSVTPIPPSPVITLHYMHEKHMKEIDVWHGVKRWVVISAAIPDNALTDAHLFSLPFAVAAWKRVGWDVAVILAGNINDWKKNGMILEKTCLDIDPAVRFIYLDSTPGTSEAMSQLSRLFAAKLLPQIGDRDLIMTSKSDVLPISRTPYDQIGPTGVTILKSDCGGGIKSFRYSDEFPNVNMHSTSNIAATKKTWMTLMQLEDGDDKIESEKYILTWLEGHSDTRIPAASERPGDGGETLRASVGQLAVSVQLAKYEKSLNRINRPRMPSKNKMCNHTRISHLEHSALLNIMDAQLFMPSGGDSIYPAGGTDTARAEIYNLITRVFRDEWVSSVLGCWLEQFRR